MGSEILKFLEPKGYWELCLSDSTNAQGGVHLNLGGEPQGVSKKVETA